MGCGLWTVEVGPRWKCWEMGTEKGEVGGEEEMKKKKRGEGWPFLLGAKGASERRGSRAGEDNGGVKETPE